MRLAALALVLLAGCAEKALVVTYEVPPPRSGIPYGILCGDFEPGDTRNAELVISRTGMLTRSAPIPKDGPMCLRLPRGTWSVQVTGNPGEGDVIKFPGTIKPAAVTTGRMPAYWPKVPLEAQVEPNRLTWIGHLCAHCGCASTWQALEPPSVQAWRDARRLTPYLGPPEPEAPKKEEK